MLGLHGYPSTTHMDGHARNLNTKLMSCSRINSWINSRLKHYSDYRHVLSEIVPAFISDLDFLGNIISQALLKGLMDFSRNGKE